MRRLAKVLIVCLIVVGFAFTIFNFISVELKAGGWLYKEGTFEGHYKYCPNEPLDCEHKIWVPDE